MTDKGRTPSKTDTSDAEAAAAAPTDPPRTGLPSPTTEPKVIRFRLHHLPQAAFAATRPDSIVQILEPANRSRKGRERQMIRKSFSLLALALVAATIAAPIAQSSSASKVDPLAVGYLIGQGLSPSEVTSWTVGACSHQVKATSCYAMFGSAPASPKVDPLAVGYLMGQGLSPSQVRAWTVGTCSHRVKAASCYAMFTSTAPSSTEVTGSTAFQWGDAGIGAGFTLGIILLLGGTVAGVVLSRHSRRRQPARA